MTKFPITNHGYNKLKQEIKFLKYIERPAISQAIAIASAFGDLSENAEYHAAKEKQSLVENRIRELEDKLARAEVIDISKISDKVIKFGATVTVLDIDTEQKAVYIIVGEYESDLTKRFISLTSPLARELIGKTEEDTIEVSTPSGLKCFQILKVVYQDIQS